MSAQEPLTTGQMFRIRIRHIWWFFAAQGVILLVLSIWGDGPHILFLQSVTFTFLFLHYTWLQAKGIACEASAAGALACLLLTFPFALLSGFLGYRWFQLLVGSQW